VVVALLLVVTGYIITSAKAAVVGDINGDGVVNIFDLSIMLSKWGTADAASDLNHDGIVNVFDLSALLSHWGQTGPTATPSPSPSPQIKPTVVGHQLQLGSSGAQLKMHGVAVWGIQDQITTSFGTSQYNSRATVINTSKSWGANEIRLRVLAADYNNQSFMTKAQEIQQIKDWVNAAQAAGLYTGITWWDSLDGAYKDANWATQYSQAFAMMTDVMNALGPTNPWVFYEPFNEPNNVSESAWLVAMKATAGHFRAGGYTGVLLLDTDCWSHDYNDADMAALETYDASLAGMGGKNQIIFAKHDYANEYSNPSAGFSSSEWPSNACGGAAWNFGAHLSWESEFGNYNGSPSSVHYPWSSGAATWMAQKVSDGTLAGATGFLFGPWFDANAMTASDNVTPTQWGGYVKNNFLAAVH
jgi:hypothetical protein